jgi:hypothetical protein
VIAAGSGLDGRTVTMSDVVDATDFLLRNRSVNGIDLYLDGGHRHGRAQEWPAGTATE